MTATMATSAKRWFVLGLGLGAAGLLGGGGLLVSPVSTTRAVAQGLHQISIPDSGPLDLKGIALVIAAVTTLLSVSFAALVKGIRTLRPTEQRGVSAAVMEVLRRQGQVTDEVVGILGRQDTILQRIADVLSRQVQVLDEMQALQHRTLGAVESVGAALREHREASKELVKGIKEDIDHSRELLGEQIKSLPAQIGQKLTG